MIDFWIFIPPYRFTVYLSEIWFCGIYHYFNTTVKVVTELVHSLIGIECIKSKVGLTTDLKVEVKF